jgi:CRP/FNR family cyclic AMP-dependent transcriptional regulator
VAAGARIRLLEHDPDLGEDLKEAELAAARRSVLTRVVRYARGPWGVEPTDFDGTRSLGLLLIEGILVRKVTVGQRTCAELLGPGDVTQPWLTAGPDDSVGTDVSWQVAQPLRLALLDREFIDRAQPWPQLLAAVSRRIMLRVHWLSFHLAVCHLRRVDDRLLLVLWHFADRWGRVTPRGVELDLPLTHGLLAAVVGAYRPSVTVALRALAEAGLLERRSRSRWTLRGAPPEELRQLHLHAGRRDRPPPEELAGTRERLRERDHASTRPLDVGEQTDVADRVLRQSRPQYHRL